ncbi:hypothetical protein [Thermorudis peleae]|uniref:hypothetical protein n=1 Tax=Thermorudis peleae TaxID=1382356 RepID=UPI000570E554|nr:hypothetical protein [Thermorudis peleae]
MPKTKEPGKHLVPEVRAFIDAEFAKGKTAIQVHRELERLRLDERQRWNRLGDVPSDDLFVSYRRIAERWRWWKERHAAGPLASEPGTPVAGHGGTPAVQNEHFRWCQLPPDDARLVLTAIAAWETITGTSWGILSRQVAETIAYLARVAPDLPPQAVAALADQTARWEHLDPGEQERRWNALGRFLGYRPWASPDAAVRYQAAVGHDSHVTPTKDGLAVYAIILSATAIGSSDARASLSVGSHFEPQHQ